MEERKVDADWAIFIMESSSNPYCEIEWLVNNLNEDAYNEIVDALNEQAKDK